MPAPKVLTKEDILRAQKMTRSNFAAARYLHVSYNHYKKYAKLYKNEDGKTLLEAHMNQSGKGIPKFAADPALGKKIPLLDLLEGKIPLQHFDPQKIKYRIIQECLLEEKCNKCGFTERRVHDTKVPLVLTHKDKNRRNWRLENLEFLCYNCAFLYHVSPITEKEVEAMESFVETKHDTFEWELDEHHIEHLKELGLYQEPDAPGEEYIEKL